MGVDLTLSGAEPARSMRLCTNQGFDQVCRWIKSLPPGAYPALEAFAGDCRYHPTAELAAQLNAAAVAHNPPDDGTAAMVELLLDRIGTGHETEAAAVTFG